MTNPFNHPQSAPEDNGHDEQPTHRCCHCRMWPAERFEMGHWWHLSCLANWIAEYNSYLDCEMERQSW